MIAPFIHRLLSTTVIAVHNYHVF